jgi:penicillin-insensitive murein endopeptidase
MRSVSGSVHGRLALLVIGACAVAASGCLALRPSALGERSLSVAGTSSGWLHRGASLPDEGPSFERARRGEPTRAGVPRLIEALEGAAAEVERAFPGARRLRIGDVASPLGGRHSRHRSHRSGRDVDILYYLASPTGVPVEPRGRVAFSRFGVAPDAETGELVVFDDARNWHLVRTLLSDASIAVQWIFCSRGVKSRLLAYALAFERDRALLARAAYVLAQPQNAAPHDDHFHVRVLCSQEESALGCRDVAPIWPWLRAARDPSEASDAYDDARLLELLDAPAP